jgi:hypothetical protein
VAGVEHVASHDDRASILTASRCHPLRVLVCGSRDWCRPGPISERLGTLPRGSVVIHGAASRKPHGVEESADMLADMIARGYGLSVQRFPANWKHYGKAAGYIRNSAMLDTGPDLVLAFQRNGSRGTQHTIDEARRRGIPVEVFTA